MHLFGIVFLCFFIKLSAGNGKEFIRGVYQLGVYMKMKLFSETSNISRLWEDSESLDCKLMEDKTAINNTFYSNEEFDKFNEKIFTSTNVARNESRLNSETLECNSIEIPSPVDWSSNNKGKKRHTSLKLHEEPKSHMYKASVQRGKSDAGPSRNVRRHTDHDLSSLYCRTEFKIPGEFLFCDRVDHSNTFESIYGKISSAGNLRRSLSTGTIKATNGPKCILSRTKSSYSPDTCIQVPDNRASRSQSCVIRNACKKMYTTTNVDEKELKRQSREILAVELQNILDKKGDLFSKEKQFSNKRMPTKHDNTTKPTVNSSNEISDVTKTKTNRRSQSCKDVQRRRSNLFNISKYLKSRNNQRSKSFATIRQFTSSKAEKSASKSFDEKFENLKLENDTFTDIHADKLNRQDSLIKNVEQSPTKTTLNFDINDTDSRGNSCLHHASSQGDTTTLKYLLEQGGNVWAKNDDQFLPIDIARNFQTAKLLSSATLFYSEHGGQRDEKNVMKTSKLNIAL